jgi:GAF domain-containing protein
VSEDPLGSSEVVRFERVLGALAAVDFSDLASAIEAYAGIAAETLGVGRVGVWTLDRARDEMRCMGLLHDGTFGRDPLVVSRAATPRYWAALHAGRALAVDDTATDPAMDELREDYLAPLGIGALLDSAIRARGETIGIVCVEHVGPAGRWTDAERALAAAVGDRIGIAMILDEQRRFEAHLSDVQRLESLALLAAGVAHDFNGVLQVILSNAEIGARLARDGGTATAAPRRPSSTRSPTPPAAPRT